MFKGQNTCYKVNFFVQNTHVFVDHYPFIVIADDLQEVTGVNIRPALMAVFIIKLA